MAWEPTAWNNFRAATEDMAPGERPDFVVDEWMQPAASAGMEPTHPEWACQGCDVHPVQDQAVCPVCFNPSCSGAYGGSCADAQASASYGTGSLDGWGQDFHRYGSPCPDPSCRGECGG